MLTKLQTFGGNTALVESLAQHGVRFLVVGGVAVRRHAPERQADDLDLLVEQTVDVAGNVAAALISINVRPDFTEEQFVNARKVQIKLKQQALYADILTAGRDFDFDAHYQQSLHATIGGIPVKVAAISTLLGLLADSAEPKHKADVALLRRVGSVGAYPCPCCGYVVFPEPPGSYDICPICFWEDDLTQLRFPTWAVGANRTSLMEAQRNFQREGASKPGLLQHCRTPTQADKRDPSWRVIDAEKDGFEPPPTGRTARSSYPHDSTALYYWRDDYWRRG